VPGNNYELQREGDVVEGTGEGHGVGLCQLGRAWMAKQGYGFVEILAHYYPNTVAGPRTTEPSDFNPLVYCPLQRTVTEVQASLQMRIVGVFSFAT
jgi:hypothetical protein